MEFIDKIPSGVWGTIPQWGLLITFVIAVIIAAIKVSPQWFETWAKLRLARSNRNADRIRDLEKQVYECRTECDKKIADLHKEIYGLRTQRNTSDAVIMRAILRTSNDPDVRRRLELLEAMEANLTREQPTLIEGSNDGEA